MDRGPRSRRLTAEEQALWRKVTRSVTPIGCKPGIIDADVDRREQPETRLASVEVHAPAQLTGKPRTPTMASIEPKLRRRLATGRADVDAVLDLHGFTEPQAHALVLNFLSWHQNLGSRIILIVTGKGGGGAPSSRGVLRRSVPLWLKAPGLRSMVLAVEEASPTHGGAGALYVRLRRRSRLQT